MNKLLCIIAFFLILQFCRMGMGRKYDIKSAVIEQNYEDEAKPKEMSYVPEKSQKTTNTAQYIDRFKNVAICEMRKYGIPASIKLAQAILESRSGRSELSVKYNNHFGIKCKSSSQNCVNYADDHPDDKFRIFETSWRSFREHSILLTTAPRYRSLFKLKKTDYKGWAKGLQRAGYATSKIYARSLISIIERYNLQKFDKL